MGKLIFYLGFTIYFCYLAFVNYKNVAKNCTTNEFRLFMCTVGFCLAIVFSIENLGLTLEALTELLGGA